jgi:uncharacterized protein
MNLQNELAGETSPYLLQHAHNPVHWQPWGEKALQLAKELNKPILVSIGYSACHWCHVMERESFENEAVAEVMNAHFVNIKIDREERPDIDHIYMDAVQALTGSGGWPLNVFLTPDAKPFYGGTYFPPKELYGRPSWVQVLNSLSQAWVSKQDTILQQAQSLTEHLQKSNNFKALALPELAVGETLFSNSFFKSCAEKILQNADKINGGFGVAPKFPQTFVLNFLLQYSYFYKDENALNQVGLSLQKMIDGGIYDQLAGGLCRYSTDDVWLAPHFEKMLYDNALLVTTLSQAYMYNKQNAFLSAIKHIVHFVETELKHSNGCYYAAIDADSEGVEGKFYTWQKQEIDGLLKEDSEFFCAYYGITETGNWEHTNILACQKTLSEVANAFSISEIETEQKINKAKQILLTARSKRIRPTTDDKLLLNWNALWLQALCMAYRATNEEKFANLAVALAADVEATFKDNNQQYYHAAKNGITKIAAFLDDYAYYIQALICLYEVTGMESYLLLAQDLQTAIDNSFLEKGSTFYTYTSLEQADVIVQKIEVYDGATASANSVVCQNLAKLGLVFENNNWLKQSENMLAAAKKLLEKHPSAFSNWACTALQYYFSVNEIVLPSENIAQKLQVLSTFVPNGLIFSNSANASLPILAQKPQNKKNELYLCRNFVCKNGVAGTEELFLEVEKEHFNIAFPQ